MRDNNAFDEEPAKLIDKVWQSLTNVSNFYKSLRIFWIFTNFYKVGEFYQFEEVLPIYTNVTNLKSFDEFELIE